ncbi:MAG: glycosyltransferase family 4 protein [Nitrospinales bacterium]
MNIGIDARPALRRRTGVGHYVLNLVLGLSRLAAGNRHHLFFNSWRHRPAGPPWTNPPPDWRIRDYRLPNRLMNFLWNRMGRRTFDLFLPDAELFHFTGDIAHPLPDIPTVATVYDLYHLRHPECVAEKYRIDPARFAEKINSVARVIAISEFTKKDVMQLCDVPEEKISVIPLGVNAAAGLAGDARQHAARLKTRFQLEGDFLLGVGTLETRKNYPALLQAFRQVRAGHPSLTLVLAGGDGWGADEVRKIIRDLDLDSCVYLPGYVEPDDLACLYAGARAFVFPSRYEGFGLPLLEAFSAGVPAAVADCAALPEVAGDAALLFDPDRPEDIADKIRHALEDGGPLKEKGLARMRQFTWDNTARQTLHVYQTLTNPHPSAN